MLRILTAIALVMCAGSLHARDYLIEDGDTAGLVEAIRLANVSPDPDRIFLPPQAEFVFNKPHALGAQSALPPIKGVLDIIGNGSVLRRYSPIAFRHLELAPEASVRLVDLVLADGARGAILNAGHLLAWAVTIEDSTAEQGASALMNLGHARLLKCEIRFNSLAAVGSVGGAVVNTGDLEIDASTLLGNTAFGGDGHGEFGAALSNYGRATIRSSIIIDNHTEASFGRSGAIANFEGASLKLLDTRIEGNGPTALAGVRTPGSIEFLGTRIAP